MATRITTLEAAGVYSALQQAMTEDGITAAVKFLQAAACYHTDNKRLRSAISEAVDLADLLSSMIGTHALNQRCSDLGI